MSNASDYAFRAVVEDSSGRIKLGDSYTAHVSLAVMDNKNPAIAILGEFRNNDVYDFIPNGDTLYFTSKFNGA